jgi:hypothetical protein
MDNNKPTLQQKGRYGLQYRGVECTNCGHPLDISDRFCPNCSQANSNKKLTLKDFFDEFFASLISYDSRLLKTLSALLTKPGKITRDYIEGKRVSYTNPFRFLLSLAIVYFLMINFNSNLSEIDNYGEGKEKSLTDLNNTINITLNGIEEISAVENELDKTNILKTFDSLKLEEKAIIKDSMMIANHSSHLAELQEMSLFSRFGGKREFFDVLIKKEKITRFNEIPDKYNIEVTRENQSAFNSAKSFIRFKQQPGSFFRDLISKLPFAVFFFVPVFSLFIWLVYIRKKYTYTEHLVFSFHNQSLLFILLIISFIVDKVFDIISSGFFILAFSIYLFLAMRKFYKQGFFKTFVKYVFLNTIFIILAMFAMVILFAGSAFTY